MPFFGIITVGLIAVIRTRALGQWDQSIVIATVITQQGLLPGMGSFPIYFLEFPVILLSEDDPLTLI